MKHNALRSFFICGLILIGMALFPLFTNNFIIRFGTDILMFAIMASAWNIIGGYTGYASFGNVVFFGIGAYTTAVLMEKAGFGFALAYASSGLLAAVFAILVGLPVLRLRGHYFAIATLGVAEAMKALVQNLEITEGNSGIYLPMLDMSVRGQYYFFFYMMLATLVACLLTTYILLNAKFGYSLIAIREDEDAANSVGINTTYAKTMAFSLSALFTGFAGSIYAYQQAFIKPEPAFTVHTTVKMIVMAVFGGMGKLFGPLLGAFSIEVISEILSDHFLVAHALFFGTIVILAIVFTPKGIMDIITERKLNVSYFLENIRKHRV
ncbi:branched-chain amino acid transport system permease protein [Desulfacinum hydrothermale DSM 13146]|uniref:Branched-chain amino acid transport system permease protein n=1 Tax=Desulfacinum hydrothermale DSM 13146 TaxID=1121390 RepID=A0A1W1XJ81_9BACT|nr:branched-chain amino acid ABC transporter permease [Desulfacinum hydrothermale]SMC24033.1 branched-chain amino acid transport system permease protein [Desulfacinum hydrothermale DSM 13146]